MSGPERRSVGSRARYRSRLCPVKPGAPTLEERPGIGPREMRVRIPSGAPTSVFRSFHPHRKESARCPRQARRLPAWTWATRSTPASRQRFQPLSRKPYQRRFQRVWTMQCQRRFQERWRREFQLPSQPPTSQFRTSLQRSAIWLSQWPSCSHCSRARHLPGDQDQRPDSPSGATRIAGSPALRRPASPRDRALEVVPWKRALEVVPWKSCPGKLVHPRYAGPKQPSVPFTRFPPFSPPGTGRRRARPARSPAASPPPAPASRRSAGRVR